MSPASVASTTPLPTPIAQVVQEVIEQREAEPKAETTSEQEAWLAKLETCESSGSTTIRVLDTNNRYSTGRYQFQDLTFLTYGKKYGLIASSTENAIPLILDGELQKKIAHKMLVDGGEGHWFNCSRPLGKYPKD